MSEDSTAKAIRGLTVAIWALVFVFALSVAGRLLWGFLPYRQHSQAMPSNMSERSPGPSTDDGSFNDPYQGFNQWPIEKQIASASAIVLTKHSINGGKLTSTVSEILKLKTGTTFYYKVGDEYSPSSRMIEKDTLYGDGEVIFFTGSPAEMRFSATYSGGRCRAIGDMPIDTLRKLIADNGGRGA